jgi:hypothetical protein
MSLSPDWYPQTANPAHQPLVDAQWALMDLVYDDEDGRLANLAYDHNLRQAQERGLLDILHCNEVEPCLFSTYSDCFKDEHGFRPRGWVTVAQAEQFLKPFTVTEHA